MKGEVPVYPGIMAESQSFASLLRVGASLGYDVRQAATIKVNPVEGGVCVALDTSGAAIAADAALIVGLHDDDNSVRQ
ncbi:MULTISPECIES: hypothetical protein [unclassified Mesorhizobium]|uniref:hypothetical protein n=1 Tax=unclassified Mesorhizobium TaxID=325217 RepID=UPI00333D35D5